MLSSKACDRSETLVHVGRGVWVPRAEDVREARCRSVRPLAARIKFGQLGQDRRGCVEVFRRPGQGLQRPQDVSMRRGRRRAEPAAFPVSKDSAGERRLGADRRSELIEEHRRCRLRQEGEMRRQQDPGVRARVLVGCVEQLPHDRCRHAAAGLPAGHTNSVVNGAEQCQRSRGTARYVPGEAACHAIDRRSPSFLLRDVCEGIWLKKHRERVLSEGLEVTRRQLGPEEQPSVHGRHDMPALINDRHHRIVRATCQRAHRVLDGRVRLANQRFEGLAIAGLRLVPGVGQQHSASNRVRTGSRPVRLVKARLQSDTPSQRQEASTRKSPVLARVTGREALSLERFGRKPGRDRGNGDIGTVAARRRNDHVMA